MLCVRAKSVKARSVALELVTEMARATMRWAENDDRGALDDFTALVLAGLHEGKHMTPCVVTALTEVVVNFKGLCVIVLHKIVYGRIVWFDTN